ncbi:hypothetical protein KAI78_09165 [bacterium]|nr:hypothetical protein [bacterium]
MKTAIMIFLLTFLSVAPLSDSVISPEDGANPLFLSEYDATVYANRTLWFSAGVLFNIFAVGISYLFVPVPSPESLVGRSEDFVGIYTENYRKILQSINTKWAIFGCVGNTAVLSTIFLVYAIRDGCQEACSNVIGAIFEQGCSTGS